MTGKYCEGKYIRTDSVSVVMQCSPCQRYTKICVCYLQYRTKVNWKIPGTKPKPYQIVSKCLPYLRTLQIVWILVKLGVSQGFKLYINVDIQCPPKVLEQNKIFSHNFKKCPLQTIWIEDQAQRNVGPDLRSILFDTQHQFLLKTSCIGWDNLNYVAI